MNKHEVLNIKYSLVNTNTNTNTTENTDETDVFSFYVIHSM